jgi:divalent metal cation (Fe/Co/Zn/Cd) transporter|tara:strand:- start:177 stop:317 length:141 start_codon:yes stop_codon:yes gene_type:complete
MEFIQEYWPQLGALMAVIVTFITMKVDISVLKEKVQTLFHLINKDK